MLKRIAWVCAMCNKIYIIKSSHDLCLYLVSNECHFYILHLHLISTLPASNGTFTYEDVEVAFKKLKPTSHADIPYIYFSHLLNFRSPKLAVIFSNCLAQGIFPSSFKLASVSPLYKGKGSRFDVLSYRPISHLPLLGKLLDKMMAHTISFYVGTKLTNKQHDFRRHRSCMKAVAVLSDKITRAIDRKNDLCGAVFVDFRRAFD